MRIKGPNPLVDSKSGLYPSPAQYNPKTSFTSFKYSMRIRPNSSKPDFTPGPGRYQIRKEKNDLGKTYKFGSETKLQLPKHTYLTAPGPGRYEFNRDKEAHIKANPKFSFGKEPRGNESRPKTPGPGRYEHKQFIGNDGPKISLSNYRPSSAAPNGVPGPGRYSATLSHKKKYPEYK